MSDAAAAAIETILPRGAALSAARGVRRAGERAAGHLRARLRGVLGDRGPRAASRGSSPSPSCSSGSRRTRSGTSAASSTSASTASTATSRPGRATKVAYYWEGEPEGDRRTITFADLQREVVRFANALKALGVREGDAGRDLHGHGPRAADRDARLRAARRAAHRRLRRLLGGVARGPAERHGCEVLITQDEAWRRGATGAAEAERRRGARRVAERQKRRRPPPHRQRRADAGGPRRLVARPRRRRERRRGSCPCEPMDSEDLLYLLYTSGTTGEAEGDRAHDGRLPRRRGDDAPLHLRRQARLGVLVRGRRRLGDRATATSSTGRSATGRPASSTRAPDFPDRDRWWAIVERYGVDILYTAPTAIRAHMKWGPEYAGQARPLVAAAARLGRRADQPRGLGLVPRAHRRRPLPDRRHVVADRDRDDPDHAAAGRDDAQAGLGDEAVPRGRRGGLRRAGATRSARRRRLPRPAAALAGDAARDLQGPRPLRRDVLVAYPGRLLRRRRRADRRGRRLLAARPRRRRDERLRAPDLDDRGRERARRPPGGGRGRRLRADDARPARRSSPS